MQFFMFKIWIMYGLHCWIALFQKRSFIIILFFIASSQSQVLHYVWWVFCLIWYRNCFIDTWSWREVWNALLAFNLLISKKCHPKFLLLLWGSDTTCIDKKGFTIQQLLVLELSLIGWLCMSWLLYWLINKGNSTFFPIICKWLAPTFNNSEHCFDQLTGQSHLFSILF